MDRMLSTICNAHHHLRLKLFASTLALAALLPVICYSTESHNKFWTSAVVTGPLSENNAYLNYYLQSDLRFINNDYVFNQLLLLAGLGYEFNAKWMFYGGYGYIVDKTLSGDLNHEDRLWLQLNGLLLNHDTYTLNSRTRLEANKDTNESQAAYRLRERLWLRIPFTHWETHSFSCYDEVFININHPSWVSPYWFAQNRAFIGIGTQLSKHALLDIGYLNQYSHSHLNQLNHVLLVGLTISN